MQTPMSSTAKAVGLSLAVGSAVAMVGAARHGSRAKRKAKKAVKKAANTIGGIVDQMQYMMK